MPVWHERTRRWREEGRLVVVGITQEQHRERCRLFAQWKGIDWPILWDPFNTTGSRVVPRFTLIDEHGIVRALRARPETIEDEFLDAEFEGGAATPQEPADRETLAGLDTEPEGERRAAWVAISDLLWERASTGSAITRLADLADSRPDDGPLHFRLGVARRMRHDSPDRRPGDFQTAIDAWRHALDLVPEQYIWRRRLQQYGPRLDKPYPFYDWVETARTELVARGATPVALPVELSGAEVAHPSREPVTTTEAAHPDPDDRIPGDDADWLQVEIVVAPHTEDDARERRLHVTFTPRTGSERHWNNEAEPPRLWMRLPEGWSPRSVEVTGPQPGDRAASREPRTFEIEVRAPEGTPSAPASASALLLANVCDGLDGVCTFVRRDVAVPLR